MTVMPEAGHRPDDGQAAAAWLATDTDCGARIAGRDWSATVLGPVQGWPVSLRTVLAVVLRSPVAMALLWGEDGIMLYNDAYGVIAGTRHPGVLGVPVRQAWPELSDFNDHVMGVVLQGKTLSYKGQVLSLVRNDAPEAVVFDLDYSPVLGDDGMPAGVIAIVVETTDAVDARQRQHAAEAALVAERDRARGVLENMAEGFVLFDHDFRIIDINTEGVRIAGRSRAELVGQKQADAWPGPDDAQVVAMCARAMAERVPVALEYQHFAPSGTTIWLDLRAYPTADGLALFFKDVTLRRRALDAAAEAAERIELALDAGAILGTWVWDVPGDRMVADDRFAMTFGLDPAECRNGLPLDLVTTTIHPDDQARVARDISAAVLQGGRYRSQYRIRRPDGGYCWIEANGRVETGPDGRATRFPGVLIDIDARRAAEAERDRATAVLGTFAEAVPGVVFAKDRDGRFIVGNRGTTALLGKAPADYLGRTDREVLEDKAQAAAIMETDERIMRSGVSEQLEENVRFPDGTEAIWLSTKAPLRNDAGDVIGLVGSSVDITDRIAAKHALEDALKTSDVLLHEVNHRVKNSLQIVTSLLMLQAGQAKDPDLRQSLMEARGRIAVIAGMHQRLYSTSQHDRVNFGEYVVDLAAETLTSLGGTGRITFETDIAQDVVVVLNHAVSLALVVTELVTNAIKYAFPDGLAGRICLTLERNGDHVVLTVADDGIGLPDGFNPAARGSLGMKIVTALIRQVRGVLTIGAGADGRGAVFSIAIPASEIV
ncbi:PAS domain-containing sensor histidine kinase [Polymorphobacter fuscus]|uniref:histidine kinase n=1 Tax=Sandarakinorhabdus fusca TaxID=1439888 RepID=A0A7C9GQ34_9SPHN|nr:PAS domain-containing protein [Polymorphobacter fuscus]KAB7644820.1 PAS domain-containing protein [Polymorphobacter fuscus]MQT18092.1 PAS domain-containing protein [Polymorphobacter fuscus]NJC09410.1 PAS domain S-box-containing protein [Polymorphobacter fuscus]